MSEFCEVVYKVTRKVPVGKVASYGQIAKMVGKAGAARAVGMCMRVNPNAPEMPCHRVVARDGRLVGYSAEGGIAKKREMLEEEGVKFRGEKVDMEVSGWDGSEVL